jgi:hypothetical protein
VIFLAIVGGLLVAAGLAGLGYCIREAARLRRDGVTREAAATRFRALIAVNLASVAGAALGLGLLVIYFMLG